MRISYSNNGNSFDPFAKELESQGVEGSTPYVPAPADLSDIGLPEGISGLVEKLAENEHEVWASGMTGDGWTHGMVFDEFKKTTPRLARYSELSEEERDIDRKAVVQTLKMILKLGYEIVEKS